MDQESQPQAEVKEKETGDPLLRIAQVLEKAAQTDEEKILAQSGAERLEAFRSSWTEFLRRELLRQGRKSPRRSFLELQEVLWKAKQGTFPTFVDRRLGKDHPTFLVLAEVKDESGKQIAQSADFKERVLKGLGALKPNQRLDDLKLLPVLHPGKARMPDFTGAAYVESGRYAERVPTEIEGIDVRVDFESPRIQASIDIPRLREVVNFPNL